jgi:pimeloyl-ACP methyl ester carboxylesterase
MATFILVHGGAHGGCCWDRLVPVLEARGHRALAPDLAGMGEDKTPIAEVTMDRWGDDIAALARAQDEKVVLVGHSRGGPVISEAGERAPEAMLGLVYLTAVLLQNGMAGTDSFGTVDPDLMAGTRPSDDGKSFLIERETADRHFYHRVDRVTADEALDRLCPEPIAPNQQPIKVTEERWGSLPRAFIECSDDRALRLPTQRQMQAALPCDPVITLDSDHSPFLHMPEAVAVAQETIADVFAARAGATAT